MRVLMFSWEYTPYIVGGLGRHVAELAPALALQNTTIHLVTPVSKPDTPVSVEEGVTVHRVYSKALNDESDFYQQVVLVNEELQAYARTIDASFDLIHVHDWLTGFAGMALQKALQIPLLATIHATERGRSQGYISNDLERAIDHADQDLIEQADHVIVCSRYMLNEVQTFFHTPVSRLDVVFNGVNTADLRNGHSKEDLLAMRERCPHRGQFVVFAVARLVHQKGMHRLVEAAPQILSRFPQTRIVIAGKGTESKHLKQQAKDLGVTDQVEFVGFVTDKERNQYYQQACCAVFPSLYEPFGIVALEAMALGCPVIVSDVGGLTEIIKHGENGITVYPDNAESVAWGVMHILSKPQRARTYAFEAYQSVEELYNWARIARLTRGVYRRVVEKYAVAKSI